MWISRHFWQKEWSQLSFFGSQRRSRQMLQMSSALTLSKSLLSPLFAMTYTLFSRSNDLGFGGVVHKVCNGLVGVGFQYGKNATC